MIKKLRTTFFINAMIAFLVALFALVFILNLFITIRFTDVIDFNLDRIVNIKLEHISDPNFPEDPIFRGFNERVFIVYFDENGDITETNISFPDMITTDEANVYAAQAILTGNEKGWSDGYRYLVTELDSGHMVAFIDGDFFGYAITSFRNISLIALGVTSALVAIFMYFASKKAIKPIVESHEKQKQFMTDASHELKTPLTVISANTEILKMTEPENEWLISIERQTKTLTHLIQQIIKMSKLDESDLPLTKEHVQIKEMISNLIDDFSVVANQRKVKLELKSDDITVEGHEASLKELMSILIDNAVKYCDDQGKISIQIEQNKKTNIKISNTFEHIDQLDTKTIFDRFYRADSARVSDGSFGLGLSIAQSIVALHKGTIKAYEEPEKTLTIEIVLP